MDNNNLKYYEDTEYFIFSRGVATVGDIKKALEHFDDDMKVCAAEWTLREDHEDAKLIRGIGEAIHHGNNKVSSVRECNVKANRIKEDKDEKVIVFHI